MDEKMGMARITTQRCMECGQTGTVLVQMSDYLEWMGGKLIQHAFPTLSDGLREQLITGTHPECWDKMFPPEEEEEFGEDEVYPIHQGLPI